LVERNADIFKLSMNERAAEFISGSNHNPSSAGLADYSVLDEKAGSLVGFFNIVDTAKEGDG
jgi:hypothetical protein